MHSGVEDRNDAEDSGADSTVQEEDDISKEDNVKEVRETIVYKEYSMKETKGTGGRGLGFAGLIDDDRSKEKEIHEVKETTIHREYHESNDKSSGGGTGGRGRGRTGPERNIGHNSEHEIEDNSTY